MALRELLATSRPVIFDGASGTYLQERGLDHGAPGELWNLERPDEVEALHRAYAEAGARILTTNTFGGTAPRLALHGLDDRVREINLAGAAIARRVADEYGALVAGDVGPTGELLEPLGTLSHDQAVELFREQIAALREGGADLVLIETMSDLGEVEAAVAAARAVDPELDVLITLSFDTNLHTMMGVAPAQAARSAAELGAVAAGANCGRGPAELEAILEQMGAARPEGLLLMGQSNAGLPVLQGDRFQYDVSPDEMAAHARRLRDLGVDVIGGCCGSTPAHIAAMSAALAS
jgi:5-methyltetrahydrofolate--homocysteine methyltransferase